MRHCPPIERSQNISWPYAWTVEASPPTSCPGSAELELQPRPQTALGVLVLVQLAFFYPALSFGPLFCLPHGSRSKVLQELIMNDVYLLTTSRTYQLPHTTLDWISM